MQITGPVNVVRLEGFINGIKKILYLFMNIHVFVLYQTKYPSESLIGMSFLDLIEKIFITLQCTMCNEKPR